MNMEFCLGKYEESAKNLWVKIKGRAGTGIFRITGRASIAMLQTGELG